MVSSPIVWPTRATGSPRSTSLPCGGPHRGPTADAERRDRIGGWANPARGGRAAPDGSGEQLRAPYRHPRRPQPAGAANVGGHRSPGAGPGSDRQRSGQEAWAAVIVAIDGGVASGKSAVGRRLAAAVGLPFIDSGLMYRAVA